MRSSTTDFEGITASNVSMCATWRKRGQTRLTKTDQANPELRNLFRHDPKKFRFSDDAPRVAHNWRKEPTVTHLKTLTYTNQQLGKRIAVPISASPIIVGAMGVLVASDDGFVRLFNNDLEKSFWERRLSASIYASPIVDRRHNAFVVCDTSGLICSLGLRGNQLWSRKLKTPIFATPVALPNYDLVVVACFEHLVIGLSLSNGEVLFELKTPPPWYADIFSLAANRNPYSSPAAGIGNLTVLCSGSCLLAIFPDGCEAWRLYLNNDVKSSPVLLPDENLVAVVDVSGECLFVNMIDGTLVKKVRLGSKIVASGAVSNSILALGDTSGKVFGICGKSHEIAWISETGSPNEYSSITLSPLGDFIFTNTRGNITCLSSGDGNFLWETSQVLGLPDQGTRVDITPSIGVSGQLCAGSYAGDLFKFSFDRMKAGGDAI